MLPDKSQHTIRDETGQSGYPRGASSRRQFLLGGAAFGLGAIAAIGTEHTVGRLAKADDSDGATLAAEGDFGEAVTPFYGPHQAGIATPAQAHATYLSLDLRDGTGRVELARMMRLLTDDAARLTQGRPALADTEPELALKPARLTVTFGFGPGFVQRAGGPAPAWLRPLPAFSIDRLEEGFSHGDLLIQVAADDPLTVSHASRMLLKDTRSFATVRWSQTGFRRAFGTERPGVTMRNLFGQIDGTVNPEPGTPDFDELVWCKSGWLAGGTSLVLRRIHMNLDTWDDLDRPGREQSVGRTLDTGAPLTGSREFDEPDFEALNGLGFPVIPVVSHIRRARHDDPAVRIFRRSYNYDDPPAGGSVSNAGMLFVSYQADVDRQFVPLQQRLDEVDLLNTWTTPVGSAVFALPPGCEPGGFIGETLLA